MTTITSRLKDPYYQRVLSIIGATLLALIFIGPIVYSIVQGVANWGLELLGVSQPPLIIVNIIFICTIFITVGVVFEIVEYFYQN